MLEITKGEWQVQEREHTEGRTLSHGIIIGYKGACLPIADCVTNPQQSEWIGNATLIADAGNCYQQCGKLPSTLLQENSELIKVLEALMADYKQGADSGDWGNWNIETTVPAYKDAMNLLTKIKAE